VILLPSVSSVYSFFFYCFMIFFSFGLQKELFFQIVICRFLLCEIASFCLFFFDEGDFNDFILFVDVLQIFFHLRGQIVEIFHCLFLVNDVCWGRSWGWRVVRDVYVRDNFRAMYRKTSWNILNVSRVLDFIECLEMIVVDLAWICRIAVACILWCKCRISFLLLFLLNEIGWFL
jgi:hypothetical protein